MLEEQKGDARRKTKGNVNCHFLTYYLFHTSQRFNTLTITPVSYDNSLLVYDCVKAILTLVQGFMGPRRCKFTLIITLNSTLLLVSWR